MYKNILKIAQSCVRSNYRNVSGYKVKSTDYTKQHEDTTNEIDTGLRIEAELFENFTLRHNPVKKELLRKSERTQPEPKLKKHNQKPRTIQQPQIIDDPKLGLQFMRLGLKDPTLNTLLTTVRSQKRRYKDRQIIIEGRRLIKEALECELRLNALIFSQDDQLRQLNEAVPALAHAKIYKVNQHVLNTWSSLTTPPGLLAVFERPSNEEIIEKIGAEKVALPITVVCDNVREPNNLGSIIRTCAALPCEQVIAIRGCCDPWESKALRGGCGGHFRIPIRDKIDWEDLPRLIAPLTMDDCSVFVAENNIEQVKFNATTVDYAALERVGEHNVVIIGGETQGVSSEAYRFLETAGSKGKCLHIPLAEGMDSLNVSSALTLILYELRKLCPKQEAK